jgi:hypothetical protein
MKVGRLCMGSVPVTALCHSTNRPSLSYCLLRLSNIVEAGIDGCKWSASHSYRLNAKLDRTHSRAGREKSLPPARNGASAVQPLPATIVICTDGLLCGQSVKLNSKSNFENTWTAYTPTKCLTDAVLRQLTNLIFNKCELVTAIWDLKNLISPVSLENRTFEMCY